MHREIKRIARPYASLRVGRKSPDIQALKETPGYERSSGEHGSSAAPPLPRRLCASMTIGSCEETVTASGLQLAVLKRVPENLEADPAAAEQPVNRPSEVFDNLSEVVRRAMLEVAQLHEIQQRVTAVSERIARLTPPPEQPLAPSEIVP